MLIFMINMLIFMINMLSVVITSHPGNLAMMMMLMLKFAKLIQCWLWICLMLCQMLKLCWFWCRMSWLWWKLCWCWFPCWQLYSGNQVQVCHQSQQTSSRVALIKKNSEESADQTYPPTKSGKIRILNDKTLYLPRRKHEKMNNKPNNAVRQTLNLSNL